MIRRSNRGVDDDTIDGSKSNQQSSNDAKWRGGGARDEDMHKTIKQITQRGGVVGKDDNDNDGDDNGDDNDHADNNDNDDNGRCGG